MADALAAELPHLKTFATLSPIPGFRAWLDPRLAKEEGAMLLPAERKAIAELPGDQGARTLAGLLADADWHGDATVAQAMRVPLMRLAARFLLTEKGGNGRALDLVEHFHLTNGSRIERLNWLADQSAKGLQQSAGMMVNYLYRLDEVEANHEAYTGEGRVTAAGAIKVLARL